MAATVSVNMRTVVHKSSDGIAMHFPDVCKTPAPPAGPVPIPYPNIAQSKDTADGSKDVKVDGNPIMLQGSNFSTSTGDEAGSAGGVASGKTKGRAEFMNFSFDVQVEGKNVPRLGDPMVGNDKNTPPIPEIQPPAIVVSMDAADQKDEMVIKVVDGAGNALKGIKYKLRKPDGSVEKGETSGSGEIQVDESPVGVGKIVFLED